MDSKYYKVVRRHHSLVLPARCERLRLVVTLDIPVRDSDGEYLLVMYPDYAGTEVIDTSENGSSPVEPGEWTPPYISYDVTDESAAKGRIPRKVPEIFDRFAGVQDELVQRDLRRYANRLGLSCSSFEFLEEFFEFRMSFRSPSSFRGYQVKRFLVHVSEEDKINVADPEMRKGFAFLPIDDRSEQLRTRFCDRHKRRERLFMGKPIVSNLDAVLDDNEQRESLCAKAASIDTPSFHTTQVGFVFAGDLAGYGRFCKFLAYTGDLDTPGDAGAQDFRDLSIQLFTKLFRSADIRHIHTAGDGFICALPASELPLPQDQLTQVIRGYLDMTNRLDDSNDKAATFARDRGLNVPPRLGSRLAIHHGSYRFGKMSLLASLLPTLDGSTVIEAARIEAGLRNWVYEDRDPSEHWIAVSEDAAEVLSGLELSELNEYGPFEREIGVDVEEKEFSGSIGLWKVLRSP
jgi:hypothetical protein